MQAETAPNPAPSFPKHAPYIAALVLIVIFFGLIRWRLRDMPLERDEGEYAYAGQLLLQGIPPYQLAYNMKLPGIYAAYAAVLALFGETPAGIHLGLLFLNAATTVVLYFLTALLFGRLAAVVAAASYALLSTSSSVMGFEAHATNFVVLPALIGILLLLRALHSGKSWLFFLSGLFSGIAFLMKQHGIFFVLFCFFYLTWTDWKSTEWRPPNSTRTLLRHAATFVAGVAIPYAITISLLYRAGVFREFWFWTVSYAGEYSKMGLHRAVRAFFENFRSVAGPAAPIWILASLGMTALLWSPSARRHSRFLAGLFLFSFLALCPGAYFRPHYFILLLPVTAVLAGFAVSFATEKMAELRKPSHLTITPALAFVLCFGYAVVQQRQVYFRMDPVAVFQATYGTGPFVPAIKVALYIRENSPPTARIAVIGSEPEIYFYAHRHSATGYVYVYSLVVQQKYSARMREQMLRELQANQPEYLVYVDTFDSWGGREGTPQLAAFLSQLRDYMNEHYEKVGVADIGEPTQYIWGKAARNYHPTSAQVMYVLKNNLAGAQR